MNGQAVYQFDDNGNLLNSDTLTNTFDAANRLIETERASATLEPIYNGVGDRVGQTVGVTTTYFALGVQGLPEVIYTSEGNLYLHLPGVMMAESGTGEIRYLLSDGLGSVRQATDESGEVVAYNEFDPYGNPVQNDSSPYGFTGEWWESDVGLLHLRARWYLPETGTFLSVDPVESEPPYQYVRGNVVNRIDPSGMQQGYPLDPNRPACYRPLSRPEDSRPVGCTLPPQCYEPMPEGDIYDINHCPPPPSGPLYLPPNYSFLTTPQDMVASANFGYSKNNPYWKCYDSSTSSGRANITTSPADNWYDVVRDFVCEYGPNPREFRDNAFITKSLKSTHFIANARDRYYLFGQTKGNRSFNPVNNFNPFYKNGRFVLEPAEAEAEFRDPFGADPAGAGRILGGFSYEITKEGPYIRWTVSNRMTRESGTRPPWGYFGTSSLESQLDTTDSLIDVLSYRSILQSKSRDQTIDPEGGGDLDMVITWKELDLTCFSNYFPW